MTNQHSAFATSIDPEQPHSLIRIDVVRLQTLKQVMKMIANSMESDQTAQMCRLVLIHADRKCTMLVLLWRENQLLNLNKLYQTTGGNAFHIMLN
jgi:hypothetical protein